MSKQQRTKAKFTNSGYHVGGELVGREQNITFAGKTISVYMIRGKIVSLAEFLRVLNECAKQATLQYERREFDPAYE